MSFTRRVKSEICCSVSKLSNRDKEKCFTAMLANLVDLNDNGIKIQSKYDFVIQTFCDLYHMFIDEEFEITNSSETFCFKSNTKITNKPIDTLLMQFTDNDLGIYLMGLFLMYGTIINPEREYHIEISLSSLKLSELLLSAVKSEYNISIKMYRKNKSYVLYVNSKESVEDFLTLIKATNATLELIDIEILKDFRNRTNRVVNCDSANIERTINSATRQLDDINFIITKKGLDFLQPSLREIAVLRIENPYASLSELCFMLNNKISRSGLTRRFSKISKIADTMRSAD